MNSWLVYMFYTAVKCTNALTDHARWLRLVLGDHSVEATVFTPWETHTHGCPHSGVRVCLFHLLPLLGCSWSRVDITCHSRTYLLFTVEIPLQPLPDVSSRLVPLWLSSFLKYIMILFILPIKTSLMNCLTRDTVWCCLKTFWYCYNFVNNLIK